MPIAVQCPNCAKSYNVPDHVAGQKIRCKACTTVFPVPPADDPLATAKFTASAPPPPPAPAGAGGPDWSSVSTAPADDRDDAPAGPSRGEPWFYGFLETFAKLVMVLGIVMALLVGAYYLYGAINIASFSPAAGLIAAGAGFLVTLGMILGFVFNYAMVLLLVDMGRSLRVLRHK